MDEQSLKDLNPSLSCEDFEKRKAECRKILVGSGFSLVEASREDIFKGDFGRADFSLASREIAQSDLTHQLRVLNEEEGWAKIAGFLSSLVDKHVSLKKLAKRERHPYSNNMLLKAKRRNGKLYAQYRKKQAKLRPKCVKKID